MPLSDRLRRLEREQPDPAVTVWFTTAAAHGWATNAAGQRRRVEDLGETIVVTLRFDRPGDDQTDEGLDP